MRLGLEVLEDRAVPAVLTVTSLLDSATLNNVLTLREALQVVDSGSTTGLSAQQLSHINLTQPLGTGDTITFAPALTASGPATLDLSIDGDDTFGPSALLVTRPVSIIGPSGPNGLTIARDTTAAPYRLRLFYVASSGNLTLQYLTLSDGLAHGGSSGGNGGGAGLGGAVVNAGSLSLVDDTLSGNQAIGGSGGVSDPGGADGTLGSFVGALGGFGWLGGFGGGGLAQGEQSGPLGLGRGGFGGGGGTAHDGITPSGGFGGGSGANFSWGGGGGAGMGGGIFNYGGYLTMTNSTLTGNTAQGGSGAYGAGTSGTDGGGIGGAVFNLNGSVLINFTTLASNFASTTGQAIYSLGDNGIATQAGPVLPHTTAQITLNDSIVAGPTPVAFYGGFWTNYDFVSAANDSDGYQPDTGNTSVIGYNNLFQNPLGTFAAYGTMGGDPQLGPLQNNGGPTQTMAITSASPAYQKGIVGSGFGLPATDQRGYTRPTTTTPSLGAYDPDARLTPTVTVSDAGGTYKGTGFAATGKAVGANGTTPVSGTFTYAYYVGSTATGTSSSNAPSNAGTFTVVATFTSTNSNYSNSSAETTFTISKANAKVVVAPYTVTYNGVAHTATVTSITGVDGQTGATVGTVTLISTHTAAGTYATDSWSFAGANYNSIPKTTITDTIKKANATVVVTPYTVTYNGVAHNATVTSITGVDGETGRHRRHRHAQLDPHGRRHLRQRLLELHGHRQLQQHRQHGRSPTRSTRPTRRSW